MRMPRALTRMTFIFLEAADLATRKLFAFSIFYLFALFATLLIEVVVRAVVPGLA